MCTKENEKKYENSDDEKKVTEEVTNKKIIVTLACYLIRFINSQ